MKEIQMFPQITEETEENLLTLDEAESDGQLQQAKRPADGKSPTSSPVSSEYSSAVTSPVDGVIPDDLDENLVVPKIVAEYVDTSVQQKANAVNNGNGKFTLPLVDRNGVGNVDNDEFGSPPPRTRIRSLSGGTSRLSPSPLVSRRMRRQSGDDVLSSTSSPRRAAFLLDSSLFRPRSKSDSKGKRPTFLSTLKNSFFSSNSNNQQQQHDASGTCESKANSDFWQQRSRSGSESKSSPVSKMMDIFRNRSNSISIDQRTKKSNPATPRNAFVRRYSVDPSERRRHPMITTHRSLELPLDHHPLYHSLRKRSETYTENGFFVDNTPYIVPFYFSAVKCDHVMPLSGKIVILEVNLKVEKAFYSLVENVMRAAPLWDSSKMKFVGMLSITDFIDVLLHYNAREQDIGDFENQTIAQWRSITGKTDKFVCVHPDATLTDAVKLLVEEKVHRLPIFDPKTQSVLYNMTHKRILRHFLVWGIGKEKQIASIFPKPRFFTQSIRELQLGTFENIATATYDMTVIEALKIFQERRVSSLPVLQKNVFVDIYAKFDAFALATEKSYHNLNITIGEALRERGECQEPLVKCSVDDTLQCVIERVVSSEAHRIIIVKPKNIFVGIISLSDIIKFLVLRDTDRPSQPPEEPLENPAVIDQSPASVDQSTDTCSASNEAASESNKSEEGEQSLQQTAIVDLDSIPFVESADEDEVFSKPPQASGVDDTATEHSECLEEKTLEEVLDKLVIS